MTSFEVNDTMAQAANLLAGTYNITGVNDDWFKFQGNPGTIHLDMLPAVGTDVNMVLYNLAGQAIASNINHSGTGEEIIDYAVTNTDTYFVRIFPNAGATSQYQLTLGLPLNSWSRTLDFGPIRNASVALYDIDHDGKDEIFVGTSKALDAAGNEI